MNFLNFTFLQDFVSNALATLLGAVIGIPIALWINQYLEKKSEKERKIKILNLLQGEMNHNLEWLNEWEAAEHPIDRTVDLISLLRDEMWMAFSDGGELENIKDPYLLAHLAEAFSMIKIVRYFSERYYDLNSNPRNYPNYVMNQSLENLDGAVIYSIETIKKALTLVENQLAGD